MVGGFGLLFGVWFSVGSEQIGLFLYLCVAVEPVVVDHFALLEETLAEIFVQGVLYIGVLGHCLPVGPLLSLHHDSQPQKSVGLLRRRVLVVSEGLLPVEQPLLLDLLVHLSCCHRVVGVGPVDHLEKNDAQRPDVSLSYRTFTFKP